jgi:heme exporter protein CcmD
MMDVLGQHAGFILAAYLAAGVILLGLGTTILLDRRAQRRALAALEERGVGRRGSTS